MKRMCPHTKERSKRYHSSHANSALTFSEEVSRSLAIPDNIFLAPVESNQQRQRQRLVTANYVHPKIPLAGGFDCYYPKS